MDGLRKILEKELGEVYISFKKYLFPLTEVKVSSLIVIIGIIVFANMLFNGFIQDDYTYIINNTALQLTSSFGNNNLFNGIGQYRPFSALYFAVLYSLFGTTQFFYHFLQLFFHIICTFIVYFIFKKFFTPLFSLLLALIFLVHPINVESVSYIAQSDNPLFFLFGGIAVLLFIQKDLTIKKLFIICTLLLAALLTKETGILFLFIILLYSFLFQHKTFKKILIIEVFIVFIYFIIRFSIGHVDLAIRPLIPIDDVSLSERILNMPAIILYYIKNFFYPVNLAIDQQWIITSLNFSQFYLPLLIDLLFLSLVILLGFYSCKKSTQFFKIYIFFLGWFLSGLAFHIQIFPLDKTVADSWFYFPIVGLLGLLALFIQTLFVKQKKINKNILFFLLILISLLSLRTIIRNTNFSDPITLYSHDIQYNDNYELENELGAAYEDKGEASHAIPYLERSIALRPYEYNLLNLAVSYTVIGKIQEAEKYYKAIYHVANYHMFANHEHSDSFYRSYVKALLLYDTKYSAIPIIQTGLKDYPTDADLWIYLTLAYDKNHNRANAYIAAMNAYKIDPNETNGYIVNSLKTNSPFSIYIDGFKGESIQFKSEL